MSIFVQLETPPAGAFEEAFVIISADSAQFATSISKAELCDTALAAIHNGFKSLFVNENNADVKNFVAILNGDRICLNHGEVFGAWKVAMQCRYNKTCQLNLLLNSNVSHLSHQDQIVLLTHTDNSNDIVKNMKLKDFCPIARNIENPEILRGFLEEFKERYKSETARQSDEIKKLNEKCAKLESEMKKLKNLADITKDPLSVLKLYM